MNNRVRNTTAEVKANPMVGLMTAMPGGIEASEAQGQRELCSSDVLPTDFRGKDALAEHARSIDAVADLNALSALVEAEAAAMRAQVNFVETPASLALRKLLAARGVL